LWRYLLGAPNDPEELILKVRRAIGAIDPQLTLPLSSQ
jgi:hypothetical protein